MVYNGFWDTHTKILDLLYSVLLLYLLSNIRYYFFRKKSEQKKLKQGPLECLDQLEFMFKQVAVMGHPLVFLDNKFLRKKRMMQRMKNMMQREKIW